jgi:hypothetical protein
MSVLDLNITAAHFDHPDFRDDDYVLFTEGDCHFLARELSEQTGWPMISLTENGLVTEHVFVQRSDGLVLDVDGLSTVDELLARWNWTEKIYYGFRPVTWAELGENGWSRRPEFPDTLDRVGPVARLLLATFTPMLDRHLQIRS